jgi:hypothetical protein
MQSRLTTKIACELKEILTFPSGVPSFTTYLLSRWPSFTAIHCDPVSHPFR